MKFANQKNTVLNVMSYVEYNLYKLVIFIILLVRELSVT